MHIIYTIQYNPIYSYIIHPYESHPLPELPTWMAAAVSAGFLSQNRRNFPWVSIPQWISNWDNSMKNYGESITQLTNTNHKINLNYGEITVKYLGKSTELW